MLFGINYNIIEYHRYETAGLDEEQLKYFQQFPAFYHHPQIKRITLWSDLVGTSFILNTSLIQHRTPLTLYLRTLPHPSPHPLVNS